MKSVVENLFYRFGYQIINNKQNRPVKYLNSNIHPYKAFVDNEKSPILIEVSPENCRDWLGLPFSTNIEEYIPKAILNSSRSGKFDTELEQYFLRFYSIWSNKSITDALDIENLLNREKNSLSAFSHLFPWSATDINKRYKKRMSIAQKQANKLNLGSLNAIDEEEGLSDLASLRSKQITKLWSSIRKNGYNRSDRKDGDITADILICENEIYAFHIRSGNHRMYTLSALEYDKVPLRLTGIVKKEEAKYWPQVSRGIMSVKTAEIIFDRVAEGRHSIYE